MTPHMNQSAAARAAGIDRATLHRWKTSKPWLYEAVVAKAAREQDGDNSALVAQARLYSRCAHQAAGQTRKYTGEPYYLHPLAVADTVAQVAGATPEMVAAALLHDVVEDTAITHEEIALAFGDGVAGLVFDLTDQYAGPEQGNRATRKAMEQARLSHVRPQAQTIKYADLIDNTARIVDLDPTFAKVYLKEKRALLDVMRDGDAALWQRAWKMADGHVVPIG